MKRHHSLTALALAAWAVAHPARAAEEVVVTGSIVERAAAEAPYAVTVIGRDALRAAGPQINLSEALGSVPGLMVSNRSNYAQDLQISSRGFGARATFGVRGIRLLTDGIPANGPDGQGQVSQFDLADAERVEVLRGPFSALYGNSSGGVIALYSAPVRRAEAEGELDLGSFKLRQLRGSIATPLSDTLDLRLSASDMSLKGFRPRSEAERRSGNARLGWHVGADTVTVYASAFTQLAQDPLGLTRALFNADPLQTTPESAQYDTRKDQSQNQVGGTWKHRFDDGALRDLQAMAYGGQRTATQWLPIAAGTQNNAKHSGGVVDFSRDFAGADVRMHWAWKDIDLQAGAAIDDQRDARRGFLNYTGPSTAPVYGGVGTQRRNETDRARTTDLYGQGEWAITSDLTTSLGARSGRIKLSSEDHYLSNGDDSGALAFSYTNPVAGLRWQAVPGLQLYASLAHGFESPTLAELAYKADGTSGINTALQPQSSRQAELGSKWRSSSVDVDFALFQVNTSNEIGVATNSGGRSAFQNVGHTLRRGAELGANWRPAADWSTRLALTKLDATYRDDFQTCGAPPCSTPNLPVAAGNRIAGTQQNSGYAELAWAGASWGNWGLELRGASRTAANDQNTDFAGGYGLAALRWSYGFMFAGAHAEVLARADNLFDRRYAGSVIVNEANSRFFETGAPRNFMLALRVNGGL